MPKWSKYLDDEYEDEFVSVERIHRPKKSEDDKKSPKKKESVKHTHKIREELE